MIELHRKQYKTGYIVQKIESVKLKGNLRTYPRMWKKRKKMKMREKMVELEDRE